MTDQLLDCLRCPIDPNRQATLVRDSSVLRCLNCAVQFPIKNGIPVLVPDAAELPEPLREVSQLPCQRRENRRVNRAT
jgi:uncharacterized protein